jgi:uncharacterized membrane protein YdjX (TVP38/TMEM64 family)
MNDGAQKFKCRVIVFIVLFLLFTALLTLIFWPFIKNLQDAEYREAFSTWVTELGFYGVLILFGLQIVQIIAAVIPGGPVALIAGAAYGVWGGLLILQVGNAAATAIIFFIVKKFGSPLIIRFFGRDVINSFSFLKNEEKTLQAAFILFLIPGLPKDTLTYFVCLTKLSLVQIILISTLPRIPGMLSTTLMGDSVMRGNWVLFILLFVITAVAGILGIHLKYVVMERMRKHSS